MSTVFGKGTFPVVLKAGQYVQGITSAGAAGTLSIPKQGVLQTLSPSTTYVYGGYTVDTEMVLMLTQGTVTVTVADVNFASSGGAPFSQTLLNAVVAAGAGSSFSYPGGSSTLTVTGSNFNGAIVTFQYDAGAGNWQPAGDSSGFAQAGACFVNGLAANTNVRCLVTGTPGAAITAILAR